MMTVRFDTGFSIQINNAGFAERSQYGYTDLYDKKESPRRWLAQVPNTAMIEVVPACRVYIPTQPVDLPGELASIKREMRLLKNRIPTQPKR